MQPNPMNNPKSPAQQAKELGEAEFITRQANLAGAAMKQVTSDLTDLVKGGVDLPRMMGDHPWVTLGSAAAAGFVVASALTPSRDETLLERIRSLVPEKPTTPAAAAAPAADAPTATAQAKVPGAAGGGAMIHIMDALKTALVSTVTSAITAKVATQPNPPQPTPGNGHAASTGA